MSARTHLSAQVRLVEAGEHLRQARERLPEDDDDLRIPLDALIEDIERVKRLSEATADGGRWRGRQVEYE